MKSILIKNQLWIGITLILLDILLSVVGWDRVMLPAVGGMNVSSILIPLGVSFTLSGFFQREKQ